MIEAASSGLKSTVRREVGLKDRLEIVNAYVTSIIYFRLTAMTDQKGTHAVPSFAFCGRDALHLLSNICCAANRVCCCWKCEDMFVGCGIFISFPVSKRDCRLLDAVGQVFQTATIVFRMDPPLNRFFGEDDPVTFLSSGRIGSFFLCPWRV